MPTWRNPEDDAPPPPPPVSELVTGCLIRSVGWSVPAGIALGAGANLLSTLLFMVPIHSPAVLLSSWTWGWTLFVMSHAALFALPVGLVTGATLGATVLIGAVLRRRPHCLFGPIAAVTTVVGMWAMLHLTGRPPRLPRLADGPLDYELREAAYLLLVIAGTGLAGWWVGDRVARWYRTEVPGPEAE